MQARHSKARILGRTNNSIQIDIFYTLGDQASCFENTTIMSDDDIDLAIRELIECSGRHLLTSIFLVHTYIEMHMVMTLVYLHLYTIVECCFIMHLILFVESMGSITTTFLKFFNWILQVPQA